MKRVRAKLSDRILQELELIGNSVGHKYFYKVVCDGYIREVWRLSRKEPTEWEYLGVI